MSNDQNIYLSIIPNISLSIPLNGLLNHNPHAPDDLGESIDGGGLSRRARPPYARVAKVDVWRLETRRICQNLTTPAAREFGLSNASRITLLPEKALAGTILITC